MSSTKAASQASDLIYLDNSATTIMPQTVIATMVSWMNRGDASKLYASAQEGRKMLGDFRAAIAAEGEFDLEGPRGFRIIFTSGTSEGNAHVVTSAARAYAAKTNRLPHIITSAADHQSILACCRHLKTERLAQVTVLPVRKTGPKAGTVNPKVLLGAIRQNTCLITIIAASHETGAINNLRALGEIAHKYQIPFHTDAAQLFGKVSIHPLKLHLSAYTASFHKIHGPPGVGLLAIRNDFVDGYDLKAHICGKRGELRGGISNLPAIAGSFAAFRLATENLKKQTKIRAKRDFIRKILADRFLAVHLDDYREAFPRVPDRNPMTTRNTRVLAQPKTKKGVATARAFMAEQRPSIVWLGPADPVYTTANILLFACTSASTSASQSRLHSQRIRAALERQKVIVSAHLGDSKAQDSVYLEALDVPPELRKSILRISLSGNTTNAEVLEFVRRFEKVVARKEPRRSFARKT